MVSGEACFICGDSTTLSWIKVVHHIYSLGTKSGSGQHSEVIFNRILAVCDRDIACVQQNQRDVMSDYCCSVFVVSNVMIGMFWVLSGKLELLVDFAVSELVYSDFIV
ncbi:hypothetical protein V6N13_019685 [Hibiscus sabdariffa]|uniref:Uncharacterized protein n=1 Tax=Hibiscus sabdariffa TaxID=183260 RepID=A0ABR2EJW2_9ROSI